MKTLPKRVDDVLTAILGDFTLTRVITEELNIGVTRIYLCGAYDKGYFAAWNDVRYFTRSDVQKFGCLNDAWDYVQNCL